MSFLISAFVINPDRYFAVYYAHHLICSGSVSYDYNDFYFVREHPDLAYEINPYIASVILSNTVCCTYNQTEFLYQECQELWSELK